MPETDKVEYSRKLTIDELAVVMTYEEDDGMVILPNGEVRAKSDELLAKRVAEYAENIAKALPAFTKTNVLDLVRAAENMTNSSMGGSNSRGESHIGWQGSEGPTAQERRDTLKKALIPFTPKAELEKTNG